MKKSNTWNTNTQAESESYYQLSNTHPSNRIALQVKMAKPLIELLLAECRTTYSLTVTSELQTKQQKCDVTDSDRFSFIVMNEIEQIQDLLQKLSTIWNSHLIIFHISSLILSIMNWSSYVDKAFNCQLSHIFYKIIYVRPLHNKSIVINYLVFRSL